MIKKQLLSATGVALALAAAGCTSTPSNSASSLASASNTVEMAHCYSVNKCKGHNDCKTANNACKSHGSCKGQGFVAVPADSCEDIGGQFKDEVRWTANQADLTQCYGVNVCKGHNDCKTAENACKGHAVCKGHGFVNMPASSCSDIGGKS